MGAGLAFYYGFNYFDPTLGTLTGVEFSFTSELIVSSGTDEASLTVEAGSGLSYSTSTSFNGSFNDPLINSYIQNGFSQPTNCDGSSFPCNDAVNVLISLNNYGGIYGTFDQSCRCVLGTPNDNGAIINGDLRLTYTYTPTPLPAALPLFATGLGGLGLLGWRRKRKAQAVA